jgi:Mg2+-importing ATPase
VSLREAASARTAVPSDAQAEPTERKPASRRGRWVPWFLGAALLAAVIVAATHLSEERAFVRIAQQAAPWWLAVAALLQAGTYAAQGGIWRRVAGAAGCPLSRATAFELSLAKLFTDQALPSGGLSSSILIAKALERRRIRAGAVEASVLIDITSYHLAYVCALLGALAILTWGGHGNAFVITLAVLFLLFSFGLSAAVLALSGRRHERLASVLHRFSPGQT